MFTHDWLWWVALVLGITGYGIPVIGGTLFAWWVWWTDHNGVRSLFKSRAEFEERLRRRL